MFQSVGKLQYSENPFKLALEVDSEISNYYRSLFPKYLKVNRQLFAPHISVVRKEIPVNLEYWGKYQNKELSFYYDNYVYNDETYFWLGAYSEELQIVRQELGLSATSWITESPDSGHKFHITLGNLKK